MTRKKPKAPICQHCPGVPAVLVTGALIYPRRGDLAAKQFWRCPDCAAYTGCHGTTDKALGRPANAQLRDARMKLHGRFDPIWRNAVETGGYEIDHRDGIARKIILNTARSRLYAFLADKLSIDKKVCHIAMFDLEQCRLAWTALFNLEYPQVREWAKSRKAARELADEIENRIEAGHDVTIANNVITSQPSEFNH